MPLSDEEKKRRKRERNRRWREANLERNKAVTKKWQKNNPELVKSYKKKYYKKNPQANTKEMTEYSRSHRECEWSNGICKSLNEQNKSLHVHHILPQHKYPEYVDGDYHGRIGNNFICFCPFHHFAYHYAYATKRNNKKHESVLSLLWVRVEQWAKDNKISFGDLEIEIASFL